MESSRCTVATFASYNNNNTGCQRPTARITIMTPWIPAELQHPVPGGIVCRNVATELNVVAELTGEEDLSILPPPVFGDAT